jgi:hypothetical protein
MDIGYFRVHSGGMTALVIVMILLVLAVAGPLLGKDSRSSGAWTPTEPGQPLWTDAGSHHAH